MEQNPISSFLNSWPKFLFLVGLAFEILHIFCRPYYHHRSTPIPIYALIQSLCVIRCAPKTNFWNQVASTKAKVSKKELNRMNKKKGRKRDSKIYSKQKYLYKKSNLIDRSINNFPVGPLQEAFFCPERPGAKPNQWLAKLFLAFSYFS